MHRCTASLQFLCEAVPRPAFHSSGPVSPAHNRSLLSFLNKPQSKRHDVDHSQTTLLTEPWVPSIIVIVLAAIYAIVALISLIGFIGAIRKSVPNVKAFSRLVQFFLVIQVAAVVAYFVLYFVDKKDFDKLCDTNQTVSDTCDSTRRLPLWSVLVSAIVPLLFQAYGVYIVSSYVHKLQNDEAFLKEESFGFKGPGYMPVSEESHPLTRQPHYPYAANTHSFGNSGRV